ncbi:phosphohydrolase [Fusobacterium polymorphum]|uniref:Phosphohydrolase n=1 Tax=Fusobacterium nucleatum subsp. polymorphum TaxID=76857 RepID=A0A2B7YKR7_FUSNP|nr:HD domain-containing protein [Fusobacterium polymorphum]PGH22166.1 phosphohydrolase [Fusobacterium polymorphum]
MKNGNNMLISRIKQVYQYIFSNFNDNWNDEVKKILSKEEFLIFSEMGNYDKVHSYKLYQKVKSDKILSLEEKYLKLALLHDSGKGKVGLFRRIKKVIIGDKILEKHPEIAFEKLKNINFELAKLCSEHHNKNVDEKMKIFQELDDK